MRILIISTFFPPLNSIASHRPYAWAKYWSLAGHAVTVLTTEKEYGNENELLLDCSSFKVIQVPLPGVVQGLKKKGRWIQPFLHFLRFKKGIFNACRMPDLTDKWVQPAIQRALQEEPWDVIVSTAGPYTTHLVAYQLKKQGWARKWIADYRDPWSDNYLYPGLPLVNRYERSLENRILKQADLITTVSEPLTSQCAKRWGNHRVATIENGFELHANPPPSPYFSDDGVYRIVHTGSLYPGKRDPSELFKALRDNPQLENIEIIFVGQRQANLEELIKQYGVEKWVVQIGQVSHETALQMQREAHALLFLPWNDPHVDGILTGKIFEYLTSGTLILAMGCRALETSQKLILESQAGILLPTSKEIAAYLQKVLHKPQKVPVLANKTVLERFDRKRLALKLLDYMLKPSKIAVIIVTYNSEMHLPTALKCLFQQTRLADKIILVDTGSKETDYLYAYGSQVHVVLAEKNAGFCRGNNVGMQHVPADYDFIFFLNPDAFLIPQFLQDAEAIMQEKPTLGAITGPTLGYSMEKNAPTGLYDTTGIFKTWYGKWYDRAQGQSIQNALVEESLPAICGAVFFCRKAALHTILIGPDVFDKTFHMYKEDIDLSLRLRAQGWELRLIPKLLSYHCRGWTPNRAFMPRLYRMLSARNEIRINLRSKNPIALFYSSLKYAAVTLFDI